jgi:LacI family transcriptional regulator
VTKPRRPTIQDVADRAGVSTATVSHALNRPELVAESTRERVKEVIAEIGFVRNASARQLVDGHSRTLGLAILEANPFNTEIARGVEDAIKDAGYVIIVCTSANTVEREKQNLRLLEEQRVAGVLITPVASAKPIVARLRANGTPVVLVDHRGGRGTCSVSVDDIVGGGLAARHLAELGHRHIGVISGPQSIQPNAERRQGFIDILGAAGIAMPKNYDLITDILRVDDGEAAGGKLLDLPHPPTAVFCGNDLLAIGLLRAALTRGLSVPKDVAIVGYDDVVFAELASVPLTSVRQPIYELGFNAAKLLLDEVAKGSRHKHQRLIFKPELVVRQSTVGRAHAVVGTSDGDVPLAAAGSQS